MVFPSQNKLKYWGEQMFKLIHKNRNGFSLVEALVTLVVLGMVLAMGGTLLYQLTNFTSMSTYRYEIQSAVKMAYTKFETHSDSIVQAYQADVLYDPVIAEGIEVTNADPSNFQYRWLGADGNATSLILPEGDTIDGSYTYIFSTPAYDVNGNDMGSLLFIRKHTSSTNELYLNPEGMGTVPVEILFSISTNVPKAEDRYKGDYISPENPTKYIGHSVNVVIKSGKDEVTDYAVDTSYTLENIMQNNKTINYQGATLVADSTWGVDGETGPAGWVNGQLTGYPTNSQGSFEYVDENGVKQNKVYNTISKNGNIMRFISPEAYFSEDGTSTSLEGHALASCLAYFVMNGTDMGDRVLDNLRLFRDNVLRGTEFGDWFIHQYYYVWSPFLIENTAFLKPVYQAIFTPISYICEFIAKL